MKEKDRVEKIISKIACHNNGEVIDFTYNRNGPRCFIKVVLGGNSSDYNIDLERITEVTKQVKRNQEFEDIVPEDYHLEISSPGADYPMKTRRDFTRNKGKKIRLKHDNLDVKTPITGNLDKINEEGIYLLVDEEKIFFSYDEIKFGKVIF
ncbi:MAG TPA: hypothetical protein VKP78_07635 [bacterium]|nr:hypothetical protein [bacterium]